MGDGVFWSREGEVRELMLQDGADHIEVAQ